MAINKIRKKRINPCALSCQKLVWMKTSDAYFLIWSKIGLEKSVAAQMMGRAVFSIN